MSRADGARGSAPDDLGEVRRARVALGWLAEPGNLAVWSRVATHGPVVVLDGLLRHGVAARGPGLPGLAADPADPRELADAALARARRLDARVVIPEDDEWPRQVDDLRRICVERGATIERDAAPPLCLWVRGPHRLDEALHRSVAVVGARAATGYGVHAARELGYGLAERGWTVVSGGAFGIDAYAHRGALAAGGTTVAVLACGVDRTYPASHAGLFDRVIEDGLLISEWPLGADPFRQRFLIRNRLIAAAARGTVLVEAGARSGARQTLRRAGQLGRCRMAMPGPITSSQSVGCHEELRDPMVRLVTGVPHILEEVGELGTDLAPVPRGPERPRDRLAGPANWVLDALQLHKPLSADEVAARARVPAVEARRILPALVVQGFAVRRQAGYVLAPVRPPAPGATASPKPKPEPAPTPASGMEPGPEPESGPESGLASGAAPEWEASREVT